MIGDNVTPLIVICITNLARGTPIGGQFGWGGTQTKMYGKTRPISPDFLGLYRLRPMVGSSGLEIAAMLLSMAALKIRSGVQRHKPA